MHCGRAGESWYDINWWNKFIWNWITDLCKFWECKWCLITIGSSILPLGWSKLVFEYLHSNVEVGQIDQSCLAGLYRSYKICLSRENAHIRTPYSLNLYIFVFALYIKKMITPRGSQYIIYILSSTAPISCVTPILPLNYRIPNELRTM